MVAAGGTLFLIATLAVLGPVFWARSPTAIDLGHSLKGPSLSHPMGTDSLGRDLFARFNEGARISLTVALVVVLIAGLIGGALGVVSAMAGGSRDAILMRLMDAILAFPPLILAMGVTVGLGVGLRSATIGIALASVPWYGRLVRSEVIRIRTRPFIESTVALGATRTRIIARHILPHTVTTVAVQTAAAFGYAILALAALGFVGLGAQVPTPEWGAMITDGQPYMLTGQWWISFFPGLGVLITVTAASIIADRSRDILDPASVSRAT
jgi:peptide/nickel transport system permease protein